MKSKQIRGVLLAALSSLVCLMAAPVAKAEFPFGGPLQVSFMGQNGDPAFDATNADVAYDDFPGRDRYMAVWQGKDTDAEGPEIYGQIVGRAHARVLINFRISDTPGQFTVGRPTITYNSAKQEFLVLWESKRSLTGAKEIYGQRLKPNGDEIDEDFQVSATGTGGVAFDASGPALAYNDATGTYLAVWRSDDQADSEYEIQGRRLSADAVPMGLDDFRISTTGQDGNLSFGAQEPTVAADTAKAHFLVAWSGDDSLDGEREIYKRAYDGAAVPLGGQARVSHMGPDGDKAFDALEPALAFNKKAGEYLLVWRGDASGQDEQYEVYAQRVNAANDEVGEHDFRVSDMGPDGSTAYAVGERPTVEYLSQPDRYLVLWSGDDNVGGLVDGEMEVFAQVLDAGGQAIGANDFRVTTYGPAGEPDTDALLPKAAYNTWADQTIVVFHGNGAGELALTESEVFSRRVGDDRDGDGLTDNEEDKCPGVHGGRFDANGNGCPDDSDGDGIEDALDSCASVARGSIDGNRDGCPDDSDRDGRPDESDLCIATPGGPLDTNGNGCPGLFKHVSAHLGQSVIDAGRYIKVESLRFSELPKARVIISLRCMRGCKITERLIKPAARRTVRSRRFRSRRLREGAVITARITAKDFIGSVRRYEVRGKIREIRKVRRCIPIGASKSRKTCGLGR